MIAPLFISPFNNRAKFGGGVDPLFPSGAIAYYKLETTSILDSVNGYNGVNKGGTVVAGKIDNGIGFDGLVDYVNLDALVTPLASTTQGTWSMWVKPVVAITGSTYHLITFGDTSANEYFRLAVFTTGSLGALARDASGFKWAINTDSPPLSDGVWTHVAMVQDGVSPVLYVDGVAVAQTFSVTTDKTWFFNDSFGDIDNGRLGCLNRSNLGNYLFFDGTIDEVGIWTRALSATEITALYNDGAGRQIPPYVATDPDAQAWIDRMTTPTTQEQIAINNFIVAEKAAGNFALYDEFFCLGLGAVNSMIGAISKTGTANGGITWLSSGAVFNGTTGYIKTAYNPFVDAVNYQLGDGNISFLMVDKVTIEDGKVVGVWDGSYFIQIYNNNPTEINSDINNRRGIYTGQFVDDKMYSSAINGTDVDFYIDGVIQSVVQSSALGAALVNRELYFGARNNQGSIDDYIDGKIASLLIGANSSFNYTSHNINVRQLLTDLV